MAVHSQPLPLPELLPAGCRGFAVLDLETTGTGQLCRIVEIALLLLSPEGELQQEWTTVIDPGVPIPNAVVHGIDDALATTAPAFPDVAPELAALLHGRVLVAHNLDRGCLPGQIRGPILRHHFWQAGSHHPELVVDLGDGIDTMPNPFLSLGKLCAARGITLTGEDATCSLKQPRPWRHPCPGGSAAPRSAPSPALVRCRTGGRIRRRCPACFPAAASLRAAPAGQAQPRLVSHNRDHSLCRRHHRLPR